MSHMIHFYGDDKKTRPYVYISCINDDKNFADYAFRLRFDEEECTWEITLAPEYGYSKWSPILDLSKASEEEFFQYSTASEHTICPYKIAAIQKYYHERECYFYYYKYEVPEWERQ